MSGSRPLPDDVTRSTGMGDALPGSASLSALTLASAAVRRAGLSGPRLDPLDPVPLSALNAVHGTGPVAESRPQKYLGSSKLCPINEDPKGLPSRTIRLPLACFGNRI